MPLLRMLLAVALLATAGVTLSACDTDGAGNRPPPSQDWPPRRNAGGSD